MENQKLLEERIGYTFRDPALLSLALTHSSYANEHGTGHAGCNERLEFLGDSVLSFLISRYLYLHYPELPEGQLTLLRKNLVCQEALSGYATEIGLGNFLFLGHGEEKSGRTKPKLLENTFESLLGALYLDCGDIARVEEFLLPFAVHKLRRINGEPLEDYKTLLQQYVQQTPGEALSYELIGEEGPDNAKIFTVQVRVNSNVFGTGRGSSKLKAEQEAAKVALRRYLPKQS
ncbi:MAG: ribonuclease III [Clostridia bacterium]|nr:ribonuclease III [Clostridia bacterium]MDD7700600.1 ribonuclease III [Eubacteriales bacterium]MDY2826652.1 ribonuclease III [Eubacteriales bacterium]